ncbi:hypothetical protein MES4922_80011 [Mesorhizobium ventifaucium]|uniref:Uncharacterized protein n=1 Tax=Mesorhizobium ventifaucium TaxID=666020 RepID=A0ABM9EFQ2_9HYPH|nr:hypothetical protein MES4922_80011 [Mesorhizobium ventifaucium]
MAVMSTARGQHVFWVPGIPRKIAVLIMTVRRRLDFYGNLRPPRAVFLIVANAATTEIMETNGEDHAYENSRSVCARRRSGHLCDGPECQRPRR